MRDLGARFLGVSRLPGAPKAARAEGQLAGRSVSSHQVLWLSGSWPSASDTLILFHQKLHTTPEDAETRVPSGAQGVGNKVGERKKE